MDQHRVLGTEFLEPGTAMALDVRDHLLDAFLDVMVPGRAALLQPRLEACQRSPFGLTFWPARQAEPGCDLARSRDQTESTTGGSDLTGRTSREVFAHKVVSHFAICRPNTDRIIREGARDLVEKSSQRCTIGFRCRPAQLLGECAR